MKKLFTTIAVVLLLTNYSYAVPDKTPQWGYESSNNSLQWKMGTTWYYSQSSGDIDSNIYNYCYIGDGNSHPLSSVTSCAGTNTTGWTLAQWQAKFSFVDSLTNEVDWVAIQAFFNKYEFKPSFLQLPVGTAVINKQIGRAHV